MAKALSDALREEITKRDSVHENLQVLDELIHQLIELTAPLHTEDEDCDCVKHGQPGHKHNWKPTPSHPQEFHAGR